MMTCMETHGSTRLRQKTAVLQVSGLYLVRPCVNQGQAGRENVKLTVRARVSCQDSHDGDKLFELMWLSHFRPT